MVASKPEILITQLIYKIHAKFRSFSLFCRMQFRVKNPRWRLTNRNTLISACTQRNCTILTAIYMLSFSMNPMKIFFILRDSSGSQKSKMAVHKNWVYSFFSLHTTYQPNSNNYTHVLIPGIWITLFSILRNASSKTKSKMTAYTPEILTLQPVYNVDA